MQISDAQARVEYRSEAIVHRQTKFKFQGPDFFYQSKYMDLLPLSLSGSPSPRYQNKQKTISQKCSRTGSTGYTTEKTKKIELRLFVQRYLTFLFGSCGTHPAPHKKNCRCVRTISRDYGATFIQQEKKNKSTKLDLRTYMRKRPHYLRN